MKAKVTSGKNFKSIINYLFGPGGRGKKDRATWIGGIVGSDNPQEMIKEFEKVQQLRPDINIKNPCWHCSLSLTKGEHLSDGQWSNIAEDFMDKMKFTEYNPYTVIRHKDTEHDHIHIITSKVPTVGAAWKDGRDIFRAIAATQELEKEYNLTQTPGYKKRESARATYRERKKAENSGITPPRIQLQEYIDEALAEPSGSYIADKPTAPQLAQRLEDAGVIVRASVTSTGKMNGFSFELDGLVFKGSKLGKAYGWGGLQKRGVTYDIDRDAEGIERYRLPVEERPPRTDSIEAARLETASSVFEEIFNHSVAEGESRAMDEFKPKKPGLKEGAAEQESSKTEPEITTPEPTQPPVEPSALSLAPQELNQQQKVEKAVPELVKLLVKARSPRLQNEDYTLTWDERGQRLRLQSNQSEENLLDVELPDAYSEQIQQALEIGKRERKHEQKRSSGGFELG